MSLPVDKALRKAKNHIKAGELAEAEILYKQVLSKFPKNKRAIQGYQKFKAGIASKGSSNSAPPQAALNQIIGLYNQGQLEQTVSLAETLAEQYPNALILYDILGAAYMGLKNTEKTITSYQKALQLNPNHTDAHNNMGMAFYDQGKFDESVESYQKAIKLEPDFADAHYNLGNALKQTGNLKQAIGSYRASLTIKPKDAEVLFNLGNALKNYGDFDQAVECYAEALKVNPDYTIAQTNMDNAIEEKNKLDKNIAEYSRIAKLEIDSAEVVEFTGTCLRAGGYLDAAIDNYKKAIKIKPDYANAYNNMGTALKDKGNTDAAIENYKKALKIKPDYANAYNNMGTALRDTGNLDAAIDSYEKAIETKPDYAEAHHNLSFAFLNVGKLKEGLDEHEWRWKTAKNLTKMRNFSQPFWDGKQCLKRKKILVWCEQGVGDTINWSSCLPLLASQAEYCILECQEKLVPLLARSFPNVEVKAENRNLDSEREDFDFHLPMGSLYQHFIPQVSENTKPDAFLVPDPVQIEFWKQRLRSVSRGPCIGVSWKSANMSSDRMNNYASTSALSPVLKIPGVTLINLQYIDFIDDLAQIQNNFGVTVHNFNDLDHFNNIDGVAALSYALDVVVSIQSSVPLISAGVGTDTKLACWRQSSWNSILYKPIGPKVEKFERNTWEPWDQVFSLIAKDIIEKSDCTS